MSMIDHPESEPVPSLRYFVDLVEEVRQERMPTGDWQHVEMTRTHAARLKVESPR